MIKTFNLYGLFTPCCRGSKIIPVREDKDISEFFHKCKYLPSCESSKTVSVREDRDGI
nr:MAG TPA: hypothetical protein [Caudoviricetes sp.]